MMDTIMNAVNVEQVIPYYKWHLISIDPDDNKFTDCALNAGADFIVSNDKHFNILNNIDFPPVKVVDIITFKNILFR